MDIGGLGIQSDFLRCYSPRSFSCPTCEIATTFMAVLQVQILRNTRVCAFVCVCVRACACVSVCVCVCVNVYFRAHVCSTGCVLASSACFIPVCPIAVSHLPGLPGKHNMCMRVPDAGMRQYQLLLLQCQLNTDRSPATPCPACKRRRSAGRGGDKEIARIALLRWHHVIAKG